MISNRINNDLSNYVVGMLYVTSDNVIRSLNYFSVTSDLYTFDYDKCSIVTKDVDCFDYGNYSFFTSNLDDFDYVDCVCFGISSLFLGSRRC